MPTGVIDPSCMNPSNVTRRPSSSSSTSIRWNERPSSSSSNAATRSSCSRADRSAASSFVPVVHPERELREMGGDRLDEQRERQRQGIGDRVARIECEEERRGVRDRLPLQVARLQLVVAAHERRPGLDRGGRAVVRGARPGARSRPRTRTRRPPLAPACRSRAVPGWRSDCPSERRPRGAPPGRARRPRGARGSDDLGRRDARSAPSVVRPYRRPDVSSAPRRSPRRGR